MDVFEKCAEIIKAQKEIYYNAFEDGKASSGGDGYEEGFEAGKQDEYNAFWGGFLMNGNRNDFRYAFAYTEGWTDETYNPNNEIIIRGSGNSFRMFMYNSNITDTKVPIAFLKNANGTGYGEISSSFSNCTSLRIIRKIIVDETTRFTTAFDNCTSLKELYIEGVIAQSGFDVHWSTKLNKASITSIINALSTTTTGLSITLSLAAVNKAFGEELFQVVPNTDTSGADIASTKYISKTTSGTIAGMAQIEGGKTYTISRNLSNKAWRYFFFDAEPLDTGALAISGEYLSASLLEKTITAPTNAKYLVIRAAEGLTEEEMQNFEISVSSLGSTGTEWSTLAGTKSNWTINLV